MKLFWGAGRIDAVAVLPDSHRDGCLDTVSLDQQRQRARGKLSCPRAANLPQFPDAKNPPLHDLEHMLSMMNVSSASMMELELVCLVASSASMGGRYPALGSSTPPPPSPVTELAQARWGVPALPDAKPPEP